MSKVKKSIIILTKIILFLIIFIPVFFYIILTVRPVEEYVNEKITVFLQENLNTDVQFSSVAYQPPFDFVIKNVFVKNINDDDTLFYLNKLSVRPIFYSIRKNKLTIERIGIKGLVFKYIIDSSGYSNLDYFLSNLPKSTDTTSSKSNFSLKIKNIENRNAKIYYSCQTATDTSPYKFDFDTLNFNSIDFRINDFNFYDNNITLRLTKFRAFEQSGFKIDNISANFSMNDSLIDLKHFNIKLNKTNVLFDTLHIVLDTVDYENTYFKITLNNITHFDLTDLGYFSDIFKHYNQSFNLGFDIAGKENDLNINKFLLTYGQNTIVDFNGKILGLPNTAQTYFDLNIKNIQSSDKDIARITDPVSQKPYVELPDNISLPQKINSNFNLKGSMKKAQINGNIFSSDGNIAFNVKYDEQNKQRNVLGNMSIRELNLGKILNDTTLGIVELDDSLRFSLIDNNKISANNYTKIFKFEFNHYLYQDIILNAQMNGDNINAELSSNDKNLKLKSEVYFKNATKKALKFNIQLDTAKLNPLNFTTDDPLSFLAFGIQANLQWEQVQDMTGNVKLSSPFILIMNLQKTELKNFDINVKNMYFYNKNIYKYVSIKSDIVNGNLQGIIDPVSLSESLKNIPQYYLSAFASDTIKNIFNDTNEVENNFALTLNFKNLQPLTHIISPTFFISPNTNLRLAVKNQDHLYKLTINSDSIRLGTELINKFSIKASAQDDSLNLSISSDSIGLDKINFQKFSINTVEKNDTLYTTLKWHNKSDKKNQGKLDFKINLEKDSTASFPAVYLFINNDSVFINNYKWVITAGKVNINKSKIQIPHFSIKSKYGGSLNIFGNVGDQISDTLNLLIDKFDITQINKLLPNIETKGYLNSTIKAIRILSDSRQLDLKNLITKFAINDVNLGVLSQNAKIINDTLLQTNISLDREGKRQKIVNGKNIIVDTLYNAFKILAHYNLKNQNYSADLNITNLKFSPFKRYFEDYLTIFRTSNLNGEVSVKGSNDNFNINGDLNIFGGFILKETGVRYNIDHGLHLKITNNKIILDKSVITGPELAGDITLWGSVKHNHFKDFYLDFFVNADTIAVLNKPRTKDEEYFGKVVLTSDAEIYGYPENLTLKANIVAENKTDLTVLLDKPSNVSNKTSILNFVNLNDTTEQKKEIQIPEKTPANFNVDINLKINPDAKFRVLMDELSGEGIEMQGSGNIKIKKTNFSDLVLVGKIEIEKGIYNFVLQNIINKKFKIQKGSYLVFNGAPTDGQIDITTVYTLKNVGLYSLLQDDAYLGDKTQANCYIYLKGPITKPKIAFSVDLPKADPKIASQITSLDEANMNKQFLSLLLIGRFQPLPGLVFDPNAQLKSGNFNPGELISNQLNNLLSNLGTDVNVDLNYQSGKGDTTNQYDVAVSIPLMNERVSINSDVGVGGTDVTTQNNNFIGDFEVDVKLNKEGNLILKGYNKTNRNNYFEQGYTQGIGIQYKTSLDKIFYPDSLKKQMKKKKNKKP